jgi:NAD(P)H dehydrogenase (quinone)
MEVVPRESWEVLFKSQGMKNPIPRMRILDGFNSFNKGWIEFELGEAASQKGNESLEFVLKALSYGWPRPIERQTNLGRM